MKFRAALIALVSLVLAFAGCSQRDGTPGKPIDLGVIKISNGTTNQYNLGRGNVCIIATSVLKDGSLVLNMKVENSSGELLAAPRAQTLSGYPVTVTVGDISFKLTPQLKR